MVQMNPKTSSFHPTTPSCLYIPHGSDEPKKTIGYFFSNFDLYIPHGSDEPNQRTSLLIPLHFLYIPHGSDEPYTL